MPSPTPAVPRTYDRDFLIHLSALNRERRLGEYRAGHFSRHQLTLWAAHYPDEIPLVNGELPWIGPQAAVNSVASRLADLFIGAKHARTRERGRKISRNH